MKKKSSHRICLAPMLSYTDRHFRYLLRLISKHIFLYTEMVVTKPFSYVDADRAAFLQRRFFEYNEIEHPIGLQLAGNSPQKFISCSKIARQFLYDEINLNIGCPSPRVQSGEFGVCLMKQPDLVCDCVKAIKDTADIPVSIKTRLGVDDCHSYDYLVNFIGKTSEAGCDIFMIHARLADLSKTVRYNRAKIPMQYDWVYRLKKDFPALTMIVNGEIKNNDEIERHLDHVDGVMLGRALYNDPVDFIGIDERFFGDAAPKKMREAIIEEYINYMKQEAERGEPLKNMSRHLVTLIKNQPNASALRQKIINAKSMSEICR